eukprot:TRINITY_DN2445_c0_g1_i1.p1 TRINITY_DN2445_c0_g1~~TRINITY_DN2445_c0_g1_i1.p1  ORF type:complete len:443 (-),score=61.04 TRINITY_DN2445_c0_g1_i1:83-1411(-)
MGLQHIVLNPAARNGIPLNETLLPQYLKTKNYNTHIVGKWHLGSYAWEFTPTYRGFDSFYGYYTSHEDYYTKQSCSLSLCGYDFRDNESVLYDNHTYNGYLLTDRAIDLIENHNPTNPFFLYFAPENVHTPLQVPSYYEDTFCSHINNSIRRIHCGKTVFLDEMVKNITDALRAKNMWEDTVFFFSTDNGGDVYNPLFFQPQFSGDRATYSSNWPLRGSKFTYFEGGIRGIAFVNGGVRFFAPPVRGSINNGLMHITDVFTTLIEGVAKIKIPGNASCRKKSGSSHKIIDGKNMWPSISKGMYSPRNEFLVNYDPHDSDFVGNLVPFSANGAIRVGEMKLIVTGYPQSLYLYGPAYVPPTDIQSYTPCSEFVYDPNQRVHLYNLTADPWECRDIALLNPQLTLDLLKRFYRYGMSSELPQDANTIVCNPALTGGVWTPCTTP